MEKRTIIAVVLSIVVLIGYSYFFQSKPVPKQPEPPVKNETKPDAPIKKEITPGQLLPVQTSTPQESQEADIIVETELYKAVLTNKGGIIRSWELKTYKDKDGKNVELLKQPRTIAPLGILFEGADRDFPQKLIYLTNTDTLILNRNEAKGELVFTYSNQGLFIRKKLVFYNDNYKVDISIETLNTPQYLLPVGTDFGIFDKQAKTHKGPVILADTDRTEFDEKLKEAKYLTGNIYWIAQEDSYFTAAIVPHTKIMGASVWKEGDTAEIAFKLSPEKHDFVLYAGPKDYDMLKALNLKLEHLIDFGWFSIVAMPLFWVLKFFYKFIGNYGWTIILITIIIRVPFIPLMHKSQQTMKKMQEIQPKILELKEKYKKDPQQMQKELMGIYKKHKVNPMGGCLPMVLQIPVFIALYNVLSKAIELRGSPFIWWIHDLSAKDPYYVLPVVMGITMVIQQKMTPTTMDPTQAKMMMMLPIVFTFMFLTFPSGLVIYWLMNNILAIAQQYYANKSIQQTA